MKGTRIMNIKLYSLIRYLQRPNGISIDELGKTFNVSRATVFRYKILFCTVDIKS